MNKTTLKAVDSNTTDIPPTTKQHINIQFKKEESYEPGEHLEFADIKGYSLNGPYLVVQLHDDTQYVYPMESVAFLKLFSTKE